MKHKTNIIIFALLLLSISASAQIQFTAGLNYESGVPSGAPSSTGSRIRINLATGRAYIWNESGSNWRVLAQGIDIVAGCSAPLYTPGYGQSLFAVNGCASPELYYYTGAAWVQISGATYYAGEGIDITNDTISIDTVQRLSFRTDQTYSDGLGTLSWDDTNGTLQLGLKGGNVSLQLGQESVQLVKHADNTGLSNGKVVYLTGSSGGNLTVRYAQANSESTSANTFGVMTEDATGGNKGFCTTFGLVHNINTSNLTEGGMVWLSKDTAGAMTAVRPTAPNNGVEIGFCVTKHATNGVIFVTVQNGYELDELHNVYAPTPSNGQVLTYNTTNARWEAATVADQSATNELQTLSVAANTATLSNSGGSVTIAGAGINTVGTAGTTITVAGTEVDGSTTNELQTLSTGTNTLTLSNGGGTVTVDTDPTNDVTGSGAAGQVSYWGGTQTQAGDTDFTWDDGNNRFGILANSGNFKLNITSNTTDNFARFNDGTNDRILLNLNGTAKWNITTIGGIEYGGSGGNPSINMFTGATWNQNRFDIANAGTVFRLGYNVLTESSRLHIFPSGNISIGANSDVARLRVQGSGNTSGTWTAQFHNSAGNNNALMIRDDGNVGIGTTTMNGRLNFTDNGSFGLYGSGSSPNYLEGSLGIGITAPRTGLEVNTDQIISVSNVWTSRTSAADNNWNSVCYGDGLFVAVSASGTGDRVMTSPDGINWTSRTSAADNNWNSVCYGNGLFVAVSSSGTGNRVMTSPDGINWTSRTSAADFEWYSVCYGNGLFVSVSGTGTGNRVMTSPDGINWTTRTSAANNVWRSVCYGNGLFVAVSNNGTGNRVMTSPDGINWTIRTSAADNLWYSVCYGNGLFVAVASNGVMTSPDGINWTLRTAANSNFWYSVCYGNGLFVASSISGTNNKIMTSTNGINWTVRSTPNNNYGAIAYGNGLFVAVSSNGTGNRVMTSGKVFIDEISNNNIYQGNTRFTGQVIIGTTSQNASSAFEVSSTTQGILFPRMTTTQRDAIATPANGLVIYNSTTDKLQVRAGGAWVDLH